MIVDISGYIDRVVEVLNNTLYFLLFMLLYVIALAYTLLYLKIRRRRC